MRSLLLGAALAAAVLTAGCDVRQNPLISSLDESPGGSATFNISPNTLTLEVGRSAQLTVNSSRVLAPYTWSTSQAGVATVDANGVVTGVGSGQATITVQSTVDRAATATATVAVRSTSQP